MKKSGKRIAREWAAKWGKQGGKARAAKMTPAERSEAGRKAAKARWVRVHQEKQP